MTPLSDQQKAEFCASHLKWAERLMRSVWGRDAEEYAGEAMVIALNRYDADLNVPVEAWLADYLKWHGREVVRRANGRPGSSRYEAQSGMCGLEDFDAETPSADPFELHDVLAAADRTQEPTARCLLLGRYVGFELADVCETMGIRPSEAASFLADVRMAYAAGRHRSLLSAIDMAEDDSERAEELAAAVKIDGARYEFV
jgi:DNA-directed RNA polymerase specialized sigma24 family protein